MPCPNCTQELVELTIENQNVLHCLNCGGSYFEDNGINRIGIKDAENLAKDASGFFISEKEKICPKDQEILQPTTVGENVPHDVVLLRCNKCSGVFTYPEDLVKFKKAQSAKLDYFKLWGIPLPSIRSIAVLSVVLFVAAISFTTFTRWQQQNISRIQAQDLIKNFYVTTSNRYVLIFFRTDIPVSSKIVLSDITTGQKVEKTIKPTPSTVHQLTTSDINLDNEIYYQLILTDKSGNQSRTEMKKLEVN